jgi:hypothetical protein
MIAMAVAGGLARLGAVPAVTAGPVGAPRISARLRAQVSCAQGYSQVSEKVPPADTGHLPNGSLADALARRPKLRPGALRVRISLLWP